MEKSFRIYLKKHAAVPRGGACDTRICHHATKIKRAVALILPREGSAFWDRVIPRNLAVGCRSYTAKISIGKSHIAETCRID